MTNELVGRDVWSGRRLESFVQRILRCAAVCDFEHQFAAESSLGRFDRLEILAGLDVLKFLHDS